MITIRYRARPLFSGISFAPKIDTIEDTVGRTVQFHYDAAEQLIAITAPGYSGGTRTLVRFHYKEIELKLEKAFHASVQPRSRKCTRAQPELCQQPLIVLDAVYYPGTNTGYCFEEYSSYGMPTKVSERRLMGIAAKGLNEQGTLTPGLMTREREYDYPKTPARLSDAPTYSKMTERWWDGATTSTADTLYETNAEKRTLTVVPPDKTRVVQTAYVRAGQIEDGMPFLDEVFDDKLHRLTSTAMIWEKSDTAGYDSLRVKRIERTDELGHKSATEYQYGPWHNQVEIVRELDFGGSSIVRGTRTTYDASSQYRDRHAYNAKNGSRY